MPAVALPPAAPSAAPPSALPGATPGAAAPAAPGGFAKALQQASDARQPTGKPAPGSPRAGSDAEAEAPADPQAIGEGKDDAAELSAADAAAPDLPNLPGLPGLWPDTLPTTWPKAGAAAIDDAAEGDALELVIDPAAPAAARSPAEPGGDGLPAPAEAAGAPGAADATDNAARAHAETPGAPTSTDDLQAAGVQAAAASAPNGVGDSAKPDAPTSLPLPTAHAATGTAAAAAAAGPPVATDSLRLPTPLHSPAFGPALGAQLSLMVRDGLSEARLQLNPAEMGPIGVRIAIDGASARVDLVAEQAPTRAVLEQSMPALASALRDSGLTLTGGGVFEQPRDPRQGGAEPGMPSGQRPGGGPGDGAGAAAEAAPPPRRTTGVLDLYA